MRPLGGLLFDIDDTITLHGRIVPEAFDALVQARASGLRTIAVTGRPGGWCDHIARMWPVDGVVGENGGLWFFMREGRLERRFAQDSATRASNRAKLEALRVEILRAVPGAAVASDQPYRDLDLAIDFREDVSPLPSAAIDTIVAAFERGGATCKVSSIHVNGWFGTFDKLSGWAQLVAELGEDADATRWAFVGDSGNDAPMFAHFDVSVGVANVDAFLDRIPVWPAWRAGRDGGYGFADFVRRVLELRR